MEDHAEGKGENQKNGPVFSLHEAVEDCKGEEQTGEVEWIKPDLLEGLGPEQGEDPEEGVRGEQYNVE